MPNYVEEAWIGQAGKRVPVSMRDTIVAFWPTSPIDSPRDLVGKALELLGREMQMLLTDLGAADEARRMAQIQRTLDLMVRSGRS